MSSLGSFLLPATPIPAISEPAAVAAAVRYGVVSVVQRSHVLPMMIKTNRYNAFIKVASTNA